jgi:hypothetical protein
MHAKGWLHRRDFSRGYFTWELGTPRGLNAMRAYSRSFTGTWKCREGSAAARKERLRWKEGKKSLLYGTAAPWSTTLAGNAWATCVHAAPHATRTAVSLSARERALWYTARDELSVPSDAPPIFGDGGASQGYDKACVSSQSYIAWRRTYLRRVAALQQAVDARPAFGVRGGHTRAPRAWCCWRSTRRRMLWMMGMSHRPAHLPPFLVRPAVAPVGRRGRPRAGRRPSARGAMPNKGRHAQMDLYVRNIEKSATLAVAMGSAPCERQTTVNDKDAHSPSTLTHLRVIKRAVAIQVPALRRERLRHGRYVEGVGGEENALTGLRPYTDGGHRPRAPLHSKQIPTFEAVFEGP